MQQHLLAKHARAIQKGDIYLQPSSQDMKKKIQTLRSEEHKGMKTESQHVRLPRGRTIPKKDCRY